MDHCGVHWNDLDVILTAGNVFPSRGVICCVAVQGDSPLYFTVFAASGIPVHLVNRDDCDEFYRANVGSPVLGVCMQCTSLDSTARFPLSLSAFWHVSLMIAVEWTAVEKTQLKCWNTVEMLKLRHWYCYCLCRYFLTVGQQLLWPINFNSISRQPIIYKNRDYVHKISVLSITVWLRSLRDKLHSRQTQNFHKTSDSAQVTAGLSPSLD